MTDFTHSLAVVIGINACNSGIARLMTAVDDVALRTPFGFLPIDHASSLL
ncbi:MAG: hypothetical protein WBV59_06130 [Anaerolineae bacterium]